MTDWRHLHGFDRGDMTCDATTVVLAAGDEVLALGQPGSLSARPTTGRFCGQKGVVLHSRDFGATWDAQSVGGEPWLVAIWAASPGRVFAAGQTFETSGPSVWVADL